jgi:hypothetical protein
MKKFTLRNSLFLFCLMLLFMDSKAQTIVTIPSANPAGTGSAASPYRKPLGTNRAYERSAMIYRHSEIGQQGIITSLAFFVDSLNAPGDAITRIFLKEVPDTTMNLTTVVAVETGATLVYDDTIFAASFIDGAWTNVLLSSAFVHATNSNLMVIVETNSGGTAGTDINTISKGFRYFATNGNAFQYWQSTTGSGAIPTGNGVLSLNRPNIQFEISSLPPCPAPPNAGTTLASNDSVCSGETINLTLFGSDIGAGISYQWLSSTDGITWNQVTGQTNPSYSATVTSAGFFACEITCSGLPDTSTAVSIYLNSFIECYCTTNLGGNCTSAIDSVAITGTPLANGLTGCTVSYSAYPQAGNTTATLTQGLPYTMVTKFTGDTRTSLWIDYNHNGVFDNNEWTQVCTTSVAGADVSTTFFVPINAMTGTTGMRIRSRAALGQNDSTTACANFGTGEAEDYLIDIVLAPGCVSPPTAGVIAASADSVCAGNQTNLSLSGNSTGAGLTIQWISSSDGINWSDVAGADQPFYNPVISSDSVFACVVTCSGSSDTTLAISITLNSFLDCYCKGNLGGDCAITAIDSIAILSTTFANGPTGCSPTFYSTFPNAGSTTGDLVQGQTYSVVSRYNGPVRSSIWIDYNHNGNFDPSEWTLVTTTATAGVDVISSLNIPLNALLGQTGMRVRTRATNGLNDSTQACNTFGSGETEDYIINITAAPVCTTPPAPGIAIANQDTICAGEIVNYDLTGITNAIGQSYQWISSNDGLNWSDISGENGLSMSAVISTDSIFACVVTCSGISDTSVSVQVAINSFINCYCTNGLGGNCVASAIDSLAIVGTSFTNGPTGCSPGNYTAYPISGSTTVDLNINQPYDLVARFNGDTRTSLWIDYNHSGTFDVNEWVQVCTTSIADTNVFVSFTIPQSALTGLTGMRVRSRVTAGVNDSTVACNNFGTGETEDYVINILPEIVGLNAINGMNVNLYPNPNSGQFSLVSMSNIQQVLVFDLAGRQIDATIIMKSTQQAEIIINAKGMYFVQVMDANEQISTQRIVVR